MKITALLENTASRPDMNTEHGLSLYIETEKHRILFDMGQTDLFARNAEALGIDLAAVDIAVLSHGHYDHGGGLRTFLSRNDRAPVYVHRDAFLPHYNGTQKYIGLDTSLQAHPRIVYTDETVTVDSGLTLFSCNTGRHLHRFGAFGLTERVGDAFIEDDFRHEQYLLIEENGKRILISGCSHRGILGIAQQFSPDVLVGGFHFSKLEPGAVLADAAVRLAAYPTQYYTCHCTGTEQYTYMQRFLPQLHYLACGDTLIYPSDT